jgi:hypothetical protein
MRVILAATLALVALVLQSTSASTQVGFAAQATEEDFAQLAHDVGRIGVAERAFNLNGDDVITRLTWERQKQILGLTEEIAPGSDEESIAGRFAAQRRQWWINHVLQPALDVAANPAASCALARHVLTRLWELNRQAQLMALENEEFGSFGNSDAILARALGVAKQRCLQEAYDECMATGNGRALVDVLVVWARQFALAGEPMEDDWDARVAYLFRRCTVYRFVYHLELEEHAGNPNMARYRPVSAVADGTFTLLFEFGDGDAGGIANGLWRGPRPQDLMSPDMLLSSLNCGPRTVSCEMVASPVGGGVFGRISLKRYMREQTIRVENEDPRARPFGGRLMVVTERREEGADNLTLNFLPPLVQMTGKYSPPGELFTFPGTLTTGIFSIAHGSREEWPRIEEWVREGYPLLFRAATGASSGTAKVRGLYEVRHRPDLYPQDEIKPEFEFLPIEGPERPPRIPLR